MGKICSSRIEDSGRVTCGGMALIFDRAEAAQSDTKRKAQVIGWGLGVEFFDVLRRTLSSGRSTACWAQSWA